MRQRRVIKAISCALLPIAFFLTLRFGFGLMILTNQTNSLPYIFFLYNSKAKIPDLKQGDFVLFRNPVSQMPIIKKVVGVAGDVISRTKDTVRINAIVLPLKTKDSNGNEMQALQANRIEDRHVFVSGSHLNSYDSRYEQFGLVNIDQVKGVVCPLF